MDASEPRPFSVEHSREPGDVWLVVLSNPWMIGRLRMEHPAIPGATLRLQPVYQLGMQVQQTPQGLQTRYEVLPLLMILSLSHGGIDLPEQCPRFALAQIAPEERAVIEGAIAGCERMFAGAAMTQGEQRVQLAGPDALRGLRGIPGGRQRP